MHRRPRVGAAALIIGATVLACGVGEAPAALDGIPGDDFIQRVNAAVAAGEIAADEGLLLKFAYVFSPEDLSASWRPGTRTHLRSATPLIREYRERRPGLAPRAVATIEAYLAGGAKSSPEYGSLVSASGRFRLVYTTIGRDRVVADDIDPANGVPDIVDLAAAALDRAWTVLCDELEFVAPPLGDGSYPVEFRRGAFYGYCEPLQSPDGASRIVLNNRFANAPPNNDPDGTFAGIIRATCAHEFKHASQYAGSRWSEGDWIELDAVWAEEAVFPQIDDYWHYLARGCPVREPELPLTAGPTGTGSYEDCVWQLWLSQEHGPRAVRDVWDRRIAYPDEPMLVTYDEILVARGSSLAQAWQSFTAWNYAVGERCLAEFGYADRAGFIAAPPSATAILDDPPHHATVEHLAAHFLRCEIPAETKGWTRLDFAAEPANGLVVAVVLTDTAGCGSLIPVLRDGDGHAGVVLPLRAEEIADLACIVGNSATEGEPAAYSLRFTTTVLPPERAGELAFTEIEVSVPQGGRTECRVPLRSCGTPGSLLEYSVEILCLPSGPLGQCWLSCSPAVGQVPAGETTLLRFEIDAETLPPGRYRQDVLIHLDNGADPLRLGIDANVEAAPETRQTPASFALRGAFPNPFNPATRVHFSLPSASDAVIEIFDLRGHRVRVLWEGPLDAGEHTVDWDGTGTAGRSLASGIYLIQLRTPERAAVAKVLLTR